MTSIFNYSALQAVATNMIAATGTIYRLVRPSPSGDQVIANQVWGTFSKQVYDRFSATGGGTITKTQKTIYLPVIKNGQQSPQVGDRLSQSAQVYRIDGVDTLMPDGKTPILYKCDLA
jgi:hypothetical protein